MHWMGDMDTFKLYAGLAVKLESDGHKATVIFTSGVCQESPVRKNGKIFGGSCFFFGG